MIALIKKSSLIILALIFLTGCKNQESNTSNETFSIKIDTLQGTSFFNKPLIRRQVNVKRDSLQIANYNDVLKRYNSDSLNVDNIVWKMLDFTDIEGIVI